MRYRKLVAIAIVVPLIALAVFTASAFGRSEKKAFKATLSGYRETPAVSSTGTGQFTANISPDDSTITFTLTYSDLSGAPSVAHIHFGQKGVAGGVVAFLCGGGGKPACPPSASGTVDGTITAADIQAVPAQGIAAGDLASVLQAMRARVTYVNMHTASFPGGEIRGQIK
jgi:hypothetical protein